MALNPPLPDPPQVQRAPARRSRYLYAELAVLYFLLPLSLWVFRTEIRGVLVFIFAALLILSFLLLLFDQSFRASGERLFSLKNNPAARREVKWVFLRWGIGTIFVIIATLILLPERLFSFPQRAPQIWILVMLLYPLLSAFPQTLFFRTLLFNRYAQILPSRHAMTITSALSFGLSHLFFNNWIAPLGTLFAGYLFAHTYAKTRSTLVASLEHALWGNMLFTTGLGWFFFTGSIN